MSLVAADLGQDLYNARQPFNDMDMQQLIATYGSLDGARLAMATADATAIINHFKNHGVLHVPGTGLVAGSTPVTGNSTTGTIQ
jgi:hypothetical protein